MPTEAVVTIAMYVGTIVWLLMAALKREDKIRAQHRTDLVVMAREHADNIDRLHAMYEKGMTASTLIAERMLNVAQFGTPTRPEAQVIEHEPDAVTRAGRAVDEDTIQLAVNRLRDEYLKLNIQLTDAELETEARALLTQGRFVPPAHLAPLLDPRERG